MMNGSSILLVVAALVGVLSLIGIAARFLQSGVWRQRAVAGRTLQLKETLALDPRRRLHLVQCGDRRMVLLTGGAEDVFIGWLSEG
jgi:flagellar protein FliO/FliZ